MPNPKRQHSKQRSRKRRTHQKIRVPTSLDFSAFGGRTGVAHRVDPISGYYKGKQIIEIKPKEEKKKIP